MSENENGEGWNHPSNAEATYSFVQRTRTNSCLKLPSKPCLVGINRIALAEFSQKSFHMPRIKGRVRKAEYSDESKVRD